MTKEHIWPATPQQPQPEYFHGINGEGVISAAGVLEVLRNTLTPDEREETDTGGTTEGNNDDDRET